MRTIKAVSAAVLLTAFATEAQSQNVWQVTNRTNIAGSVVDWDGIFGPMPISDQSVFAGWRTVGETGMSISVSSPGALDLQRQGSEWMGNFNHDDPVLKTAASPLSIMFDNDVYAVGANIQDIHFGAYGFTGVITAYDVNDQLLGSVSALGYSNNTPGTALFLGLWSELGIRRITFETFGGLKEFGINQLSFGEFSPPLDESDLLQPITIEQDVQVIVNPEPSSILLMAAGMAGLGFVGYRRRKAVADNL